MLRQRTLVVAALALACILPANATRAQVETGDAKEQSRAHFERGNQLLADGQVDAALAEFQRSRELFATSGNTKNLAVALAKLGRYVEAIEMYRTLLRDFDVDKADREVVEHEIEIL